MSNRLGLFRVSPEYLNPLRAFCMTKLNCGIIGGQPQEALYLVGMQEQNMVLLDPHNSAAAFAVDPNSLQRNHFDLHEQTAKKISYTNLDPTMTFAFYLKSHKELAAFKVWQSQ